jgi:hypothetical protein
MGEVNVFDCSFSESDPLRGQLAQALGFAKEPPPPRIVRSQPDYQAIEKRTKAESDSSRIDPSVVDSVVKSIEEQGER